MKNFPLIVGTEVENFPLIGSLNSSQNMKPLCGLLLASQISEAGMAPILRGGSPR
jgi:hypothetical protein